MTLIFQVAFLEAVLANFRRIPAILGIVIVPVAVNTPPARCLRPVPSISAVVSVRVLHSADSIVVMAVVGFGPTIGCPMTWTSAFSTISLEHISVLIVTLVSIAITVVAVIAVQIAITAIVIVEIVITVVLVILVVAIIAIKVIVEARHV